MQKTNIPPLYVLTDKYTTSVRVGGRETHSLHSVCTETHKYGILEVDGDHRVLCMKEKPHQSETTSRRAVSIQ